MAVYPAGATDVWDTGTRKPSSAGAAGLGAPAALARGISPAMGVQSPRAKARASRALPSRVLLACIVDSSSLRIHMGSASAAWL